MAEPYHSDLKPFEVDADVTTLAEKWKEWKTAVEYMIQARGITNATRKEAILLHSGGIGLQQIYLTLPDPEEEEQDVYKKAIKKLDKYFEPKGNEPFERHKFRKMKQEDTESISFYVSRLRRQANYCNFTDKDTQIRDQLIEGCTSSRLRKQFLEKGNELNLNEALKLSSAFEAVQYQSSEMSGNGNVNKVDQVKSDKPKWSQKKAKCWRCNLTGHFAKDDKCPAKSAKCRKCGNVGHFEIVCRTDMSKHKEKKDQKQYKKFTGKKKVYTVESDEEDEDTFAFTVDDQGMKTIKSSEEATVNILINGQSVKMLIDSGASCNVIDEELWNKLKTDRNIQGVEVDKKLKPYGNSNPIQVRHKFKTEISLKGTGGDQKTVETEFLVIAGKARPLLGKKTAMEMGVLEIKIPEINSVETEFKALFSGKVGKLTNYQVELHVKKDPEFIAQPCRRIPYSMRPKLEEKLKELEELDIIERVEGPTPCVSPIVIVPKPSGDIRVCVDMRVANKSIERARHPIPTVDEVINELSGNKVFTKMDLKMGYHQLELKEGQSREVTTFATHVGLFRYKRLMFGICSAPELYQHVIRQVLTGGGCEGCQNISDDIVVYGKDVEEHDRRLEKVLKTLQERGLTVNPDKCSFRMNEVEFMGHLLNEKGIGPTESRVKALKDAREPQDKAEIRSFLGLVNFSARYIPNLATKTEPLRRIMGKDKPFKWEQEQQKAFDELRNALCETQILCYFDPKAETRVIADASPVGLGAVLQQRHGKDWKPVYYASRSLSNTEQKYSQTEREALGLVWAVEKFHVYLYGREFELVTDHKPLEVIYSVRSKPSARIERWVLRLQPYNFHVKYLPGKKNVADCLSRLLENKVDTQNFDDSEEYINFISAKAIPRAMRAEEIAEATKGDEEMCELKRSIQTGSWENSKDFIAFANELCVIGEVIMRGTRIVVPRSLRAKVLSVGHEGHPGIVSMKQRLRTKVWWPKMERDVEKHVKHCASCQLVSQGEPPEPIASTELPSGPWRALAIDYLGPLPSGDYILVVVDYYSRYYEVDVMKTITAEKTIQSLEIIFARHGLPEVIVSDNGRQFTAEIFAEFCDNNGIHHRKVTPKWAQANGEVERQNRSIMKRLKIAQAENKDWKRELIKYLGVQRTTPHQTTGKTPAELLFNRKLRTKLPQITEQVYDQETRDKDAVMKFTQRQYADTKRNAKPCEIKAGDQVLVKQTPMNKMSTPFEQKLYDVKAKTGNQIIIADENRVLKRNVTEVKKFNTETESTEPERRLNNHEAAQEKEEKIKTPERRYPVRERRAPVKLDL